MKYLMFILALASAFAVSAEKLPAGHPSVNGNNLAKQVSSEALAQKAKVIEVINVPQYTYLEVSQNNQSRWIAAPSVDVKKEDVIAFNDGAMMTDFYSKTLDRTFPSIAFVNQVVLSK
ncbi:MAG: hypothetical protein NTV00_03435 [Methylococcales bacterium]|nr:hypothetical protein [Methylococcales bacterium]